jgi:hypothetical protein
MTTEHTVVSFRQIKKKAVQFSGRLLANYRDLCLQLPPLTRRNRGRIIRLPRALAHGAEIMFGVLVGILRLDLIAG